MKYALVLEKDSQSCKNTLDVLSSMGYLITPVFNPKKALHAVHMIQFDLIVTCTAVNPGDRRSLIGELKRCSSDSVVVLLAEPGRPDFGINRDEADAVLQRPLTVEALRNVVEVDVDDFGLQAPLPKSESERRRKTL